MDPPEPDHPLSSPSTSPSRDEAETLVFSVSTSFHPLALSISIGADDPPVSPQHANFSPSSSFLDPPSYADAVYTTSPSQSNHVSFASSLYSQITVGSPQKEQEGSNSIVSTSYVTYLVTTKFAIDGEEEVSVRRRFRDVVTLADQLAEAYRGFFVPSRPDKNVVESQMMQKQEFVEQRRIAIEKYLRRLAAHPVIGKSDELKAFLQGKVLFPGSAGMASSFVQGETSQSGQLIGEEDSLGSPKEFAQPTRGGRDFFRMFRELKQSVVNDWVGAKPAVVEEDKEFLEKKEKMQDLEQQLITSSQQAEALVTAQQDLGLTMGELGLMFIKLTKFETEEALYDSQKIRAADARSFGTAAVKASRFYRELNSQTVKQLEALHEYLGLMVSVNTAFSDRSSALLTVQTLGSDLSSLHAKAEKLEISSSKIFGGDKSRIRKLEELKETIRTMEEAKSTAIREYEHIKENNRNELERLNKERRRDFFGMLRTFVINQVGYAEKITSVWENVVEDTSRYARVE